MARGEIVISETFCKGCGYCTKFCARGCIVQTGGKFSPQGYLLAEFVNTDKCNACGICAWMCPDHAIEVYRLVEAQTATHS